MSSNLRNLRNLGTTFPVRAYTRACMNTIPESPSKVPFLPRIQPRVGDKEAMLRRLLAIPGVRKASAMMEGKAND